MYHIAITGHRPKDLGGLGPSVVKELACDMLDRAQKRAGSEGIMVHTGGALGVDQWVAAAVLNSPYYMQGHEHTLHRPFDIPVMGKFWSPEQVRELQRINDQSAVCVKCPQSTYSAWAYEQRNRHMVDSASVLVAFWTGKTNGGTWNAIRYAWERGVPIYNALNGMNRVRL